MTQPSTKTATVESPLSALRRKWWLPLVLCPVGAALGAGVGVVSPAKYTAETRLSVGAGELSAQAVPGFALARQQLAEDYARWVDNDAAQIDGDKVTVTSSPIPNSAIIRIEGVSTDQAAAMDTVRKTSAQLVKHINASKPGNDPAQVLKQYQTAASKAAKVDSAAAAANSEYLSAVGAGRGAGALATLKDTLDQRKAQAALLDVRRDALAQKYQQLVANQTTAVNLTTVRNPAVTGNDRTAKMERFGLLGFVAGGLVSLLLATLMGRRRVVRPAAGAPRTRRVTAPAQAGSAPRAEGPDPREAARPQSRQDGTWAQTRASVPGTPSTGGSRPLRRDGKAGR